MNVFGKFKLLQALSETVKGVLKTPFGRRLVNLLQETAYFKCHWSRSLHLSCSESCSCKFRMAFLGTFWKDRAEHTRGYKDISRRSDVGAAKFDGLSSVQARSQTPQLTAACLVSFCSSNRRVKIIIAKNYALNSSRRRKQMKDD